MFQRSKGVWIGGALEKSMEMVHEQGVDFLDSGFEFLLEDPVDVVVDNVAVFDRLHIE